MVKNGKTKAGKQRYRCLECGSSQSRSELRRIKPHFGGATCIRKTPLEPAEMLESMPRNKDLQSLINEFRPQRRESIYPDTYGNAVVYSELQQAYPIPIQQNNLFTHFLSYNPGYQTITEYRR